MSSDAGYTWEQLQKLEELFVECKIPNKKLLKKWSKDLRMDRDEIKCWFQNKRLLLHIEEIRRQNEALRRENAIIQRENIVMIKNLENLQECSSCSRNETRETLLHENAMLREEHQRVTNLLLGILQNPDLVQLQRQESKVDIDLELSLAPSMDKFDN